MFQLDNKLLALDTAFTHNEISYPANWLRLASPEERETIGITEVDDAASYDDRFYWGVDNPKDLTGLKTQWSAWVKTTANQLLSATDWMVIRKAERNVDIPADTVAYRAGVLAECNRLLAAIETAADVAALITVVTTQNWPEA
ncbi:hypothetical protein UFOVP128_21 [uncultured Caudovirales phage]|uniref:Uncharacterized protein n=1 Tax=uncultured Caudovirales phage TaxID=2100421 RepID=A0A6J5LBF9_9CAUD|nr:hypothetical protein UFOVP128_21 [uncultured Caudovirales phage]CAB5222054.1 hypothetical protein UFOVP243_23 [uncultured Caudovirales phage]